MAKILNKHIQSDYKNYLINGALDYWQYNASAALVNDDSSYTYRAMDRFQTRYDGAGAGISVAQWRRVADAPTGLALAYEWSFRRNSGGGHTGIIRQSIESTLAQELYHQNPLKKISFSFWIRSDTSTTINAALVMPTAQDDYTSTTAVWSSSTTFLANSTWQLIKFENISVASSVINNGLRLQLNIVSPIAGSLDGVDKFVRVAGFQMNKGEKVGTFQRHALNPEDELAACQRFYEKSYKLTTSAGAADTDGITVGIRPAGSATWSQSFKVAKRIASPTCVPYTSANPNTPNTVRNINVGSDIATSILGRSEHGFYFSYTASVSDGISFHWTALAEIA